MVSAVAMKGSSAGGNSIAATKMPQCTLSNVLRMGAAADYSIIVPEADGHIPIRLIGTWPRCDAQRRSEVEVIRKPETAKNIWTPNSALQMSEFTT
jgi:hypothetical protein